jgi:translation elongation factor EF-Tu-like GTPase
MNKTQKNDIVADVRFFSTEEGGRESPIPQQRYGCIFTYQNENFSCFPMIPNNVQVCPGDKVTLEIKFLYPNLIKPKLKVGDKFTLRESRVIAEGKVRESIE